MKLNLVLLETPQAPYSRDGRAGPYGNQSGRLTRQKVARI